MVGKPVIFHFSNLFLSFLFRVDDILISVMKEQEEHQSMMDWSFLPPLKKS